MYYLKSRYYDPEACRFINADKFASTGQGILGSNMFAYCGNNVVNRIDLNGTKMVCLCIEGGGISFDDDQTTCYYSSMAIGESTVSEYGCGLVAAKNTLRAHYIYYLTIEDIYEAICDNGGLAGNGENGISSGPLIDTIATLGRFKVTIGTGPSFTQCEKCSTVVVFYGFYSCTPEGEKRKYGHCIAGVKGENGFVFYNDPITPNSPMSIAEYCSYLDSLILKTGDYSFYYRIEAVVGFD